MFNRNLIETLQIAVEEHKYVNVGVQGAAALDVRLTKLHRAVDVLRRDGRGYRVVFIKIDEVTVKVLTKHDVTWADVYKNKNQIVLPTGEPQRLV